MSTPQQPVSVFQNLGQETTLQEARDQITALLAAAGVQSDQLQSVADAITGKLLVADATPPLVQLSCGGTTINASAAAQVLPANPGRILATVQHCGTAGFMWLRWDGAAAAPNNGEKLAPGDQWERFTAAAVSVYFEGTGSARAATTEAAA